MPPPSGHVAQTPEPKSTGLGGVFKTLTGQKKNGGLPLSPYSPSSIPVASVQLAQQLNGPDTSRGAIYDGPSEYEELHEKLKPGNSFADRLEAADALRLAVSDYLLSGVTSIWYAAKDLISPENPAEVRRTGFELLRACVKHSSATGLERKEYFNTLTAPLHPDDYHLQLAAVAELAKNGKDLSGFHYDAMPLLTRWLRMAFEAFERARKSPRQSSKSNQPKEPLGEETNIHQLFNLIVNVIKFSFNVLDDEETGALIDEITYIAVHATFPNEIRACVRMLDAIVTYGAIPSVKLKDFVSVLCAVHFMVRDIRREAWHTIGNLCRSHNGHTTVWILLDVLRHPDMNQKTQAVIREVRGSLSVLERIISKGGEGGYPPVPFGLLIEALSMSLIVDQPKVDQDIMHLILSLFGEDEASLNSSILEEDWTKMFDIVSRCAVRALETSDGKVISKTTLQLNSSSSASSTTNSSTYIATGIAQTFYELITRVEYLLLSMEAGEFMQRESCILFFSRVSVHIPDSCAKLVIRYYIDFRFCYPSDSNWELNIKTLLDAFFLNRNRQTETRLQALQAVTDVYDLVDKRQTPVLLAAENGHVAVLKLLLEESANVGAKDTENLLKLIQMTWSGLSSNEERSGWLEVLALIGMHQKLGADAISNQWEGYLRCQWEIPDVLEETRISQTIPERYKLQGDTYDVLARFIILTGTTDSFECATCGEFLERRWNDIGLNALRVISRGIELLASWNKISPDLMHEESSQTADISIVSVTKNAITIFFNSMEYDKQSYVEAISWTCAAIRATLNESTQSNGKLSVSKAVKAIQIEGQQPQLLGYSIQPLEDLSQDDIGSKDCWTKLFKSGVVAWSPTQREWGFGLELSFNMMVHLATVESYYWLDDPNDEGGLVLLGFFTALVPTSQHKASKSIQWHFESTEEVISPHSLKSTQRAWIKILDASEFQHSRCFIGWYERANVLLGTRRLETHLDSLTWSGLKPRERTLHSSGFQAGVQVTAGSGYMGPINLALQGTKNWIFQTNVQQFTTPTQYSTAVALSSNKVALVLDSESKQAWLIPKLSLILHLCHKYFHEFRPPIRDIEDPVPFAEPAPNGSWATQQAIATEGDTIVLGALGQADTETLRQVFLRINTNLLDSVKTREKPRNALMFASEIMDMWDQPSTGSPLKEVSITRGARSWTCLVNMVDVFCVCANIGPAIEPVPILNNVCDCCMLPENQYYLAAHMWCLEQLSRRARSSTNQLQYGMCKLGEDAFWAVQTSPWRRCGSEAHLSIWGDINLLDTLLQKVSSENKGKNKEVPEIVLHEPPPDTGVVVFGTRRPKLLVKQGRRA